MKKSNFIKIIALVLSTIFVISALVACDDKTPDAGSTGSNDPKAITLGGADIAEYTLVYGKSEPTAKQMALENNAKLAFESPKIMEDLNASYHMGQQ